MGEPVLTTLKILIIGESGVGKSSLLLRFTDDDFNSEQCLTIGVDFKAKVLNVDGHNVKLALWDTAGQERFRALSPSYYRDAQGVILVYDVTSRASFERLSNWKLELDTWATKKDMVKMIIGNKTDKRIERVVSKEEGLAFARRQHALFLEASAKTNDSVVCAFEELATKIIQTPGLWETSSRGDGKSLTLSSTSAPELSPSCGGWCGSWL